MPTVTLGDGGLHEYPGVQRLQIFPQTLQEQGFSRQANRQQLLVRGEKRDYPFVSETVQMEGREMTDDYILNAEQCETCVNNQYFPVRQPCVNCLDDHPLRVSGRHYIKNKVTNLSRIQHMPAEELAEYLFERGNGSEYCYGICSYQDECKEYHPREFCIGRIVEWLNQEVKE